MQAKGGYKHIAAVNDFTKTLTRRNEKMIHPRNSHFPILKGIATQPLCESGGQLLKIAFDHDFVDNMVMAVKISDM